jgi:hypothetical protein
MKNILLQLRRPYKYENLLFLDADNLDVLPDGELKIVIPSKHVVNIYKLNPFLIDWLR